MSSQHSSREIVRVLDRDLAECAGLLRDATPRGLKRYAGPGLPTTSLARERCGDTSNRVYRVVVLFRALARAGEYSGIDLILAHLTAIRDELVGAAMSFLDATIAEQEADGAEDVAQARALIDVSALPEYVRAAEHDLAMLRGAIASARREIAARERAA